jgi:hypothetical protein
MFQRRHSTFACFTMVLILGPVVPTRFVCVMCVGLFRKHGDVYRSSLPEVFHLLSIADISLLWTSRYQLPCGSAGCTFSRGTLMVHTTTPRCTMKYASAAFFPLSALICCQLYL